MTTYLNEYKLFMTACYVGMAICVTLILSCAVTWILSII